MDEQGSSYAQAGVDIDAAQMALSSVREAISSSHGPEVVGGVGGFGSMFHAHFPGVERPVLVSSIDGVGTKTKIAQMVGDYSGIGKDIVNHCVNDILCQGARPLYFLDYFGCSKLEQMAFEQVVRGAAEACAAVGCALVGGETAEMPGVYHDGEIDIVGAITGVVDWEMRLPKGKMQPGDRLIGLASNGLHTNGYSLARRALFDMAGLSVRDPLPGDESETVGEALLKPHICYFNHVFPLIQHGELVKGVAHITGGGLYDNLPRILPKDVQAKIVRRNWIPLPIFTAIQQCGRIEDAEMYRAFNMGIGMVLIVDQDSCDTVVNHLNDSGSFAAEIGKLHGGPRDVQIV
ncbi:phosphoribosylformylglycinamidine cyclo-ligase [Kamptonema cortianum]|nr:phosphoribosylformylglycinamidine cyclo-ligase [Geitlerinema splendidum]MDK3160989.1 phosphoribosylformylglycinamidine cyclo-ligase [Kamptonema cortianum]